MVNHKEILRLKSLGLTHQEIAVSCGCGRNTVTRTLARAREQSLSWVLIIKNRLTVEKLFSLKLYCRDNVF